MFQVGRSQVLQILGLLFKELKAGDSSQICKRKKYDNFIQNEIKVQILAEYTFKIDYEPLKNI